MGRKRTKPDNNPRSWYGRGWWCRVRAQQLREEPLCQTRLRAGVVTAASEVDHVKPHKGDWNEFRTGKLQSLCRECHRRKTEREQGFRQRPRGWRLDGMPIWD